MGYFSGKKKSAGNLAPRQADKETQLSFLMPVDFSNLNGEMITERDFRMLQSMYPDIAKKLLPYLEEECDRLEYEGSAMFDEYPDFTTIDTLQKKIIRAVEGNDGREAIRGEDAETAFGGGKVGGCVPYGDLIRVLLLQEIHRRRARHRFCRENGTE